MSFLASALSTLPFASQESVCLFVEKQRAVDTQFPKLRFFFPLFTEKQIHSLDGYGLWQNKDFVYNFFASLL